MRRVTPADQSILVGDGSGRTGDCWRACVATLLDLPTTDVPHFAEIGTVSNFDELTDAWLRDRGFRLVDGMICRGMSGAYALLERGDDAHFELLSPDYLIVGGPTSRGTRHVVIANAADYFRLVEEPKSEATCARWLAHDPHPSRAGLLAWDRQYAIVPIRGNA